MFTDLYLRTTDPEQSLNKMMAENILGIVGSVLFHTIVYWLFVCLVSYIFLGRGLSMRVHIRLIIALLFIMFFGYIGRYYHVQEIYRAYGRDKLKTRAHLDRLYIGWIFIG